MMAQLLVRDLDEMLVRLLRQRASANNRSAEAEHRAILEQALLIDGEPFWEVARRLRDETAGHTASDSTEIVRHYRDTRY